MEPVPTERQQVLWPEFFRPGPAPQDWRRLGFHPGSHSLRNDQDQSCCRCVWPRACTVTGPKGGGGDTANMTGGREAKNETDCSWLNRDLKVNRRLRVGQVIFLL